MIHKIKRIRSKNDDKRIALLEREIFHLWEFIWQEGLGEDAREFIRDSEGEPLPLILE